MIRIEPQDRERMSQDVVDVLVYTATDFWVKTFIFCDNKWVLNCSIQTQTEVVVQKSRPCVAERDVVATHEACVLHEVVACALSQVISLNS